MRSVLGEQLRKLRIDKGLSRKELAARTRISSRYIACLEEGDLETIPGRVFVSGFIRSICLELGRDPQELLSILSDCYPEEVYDELEQTPPQKRNYLSFGLAAAVLLFLIGVGALLISKSDNNETGHEQSRIAVNSASQSENGADNTSGGPVEAEVLPDLDLKIYAIERTWLRIQTDDSEPWETTMMVGDQIQLKAGDRIMLHIGNAGGIFLDLNGKRFGPPGSHGQVVSNFVLTRDNL